MFVYITWGKVAEDSVKLTMREDVNNERRCSYI